MTPPFSGEEPKWRREILPVADQHRDEIDQHRYALGAWQKNTEFLARYRTLAEDAAYTDLVARFTAALNTKPDDDSAAEAAVGYSLT